MNRHHQFALLITLLGVAVLLAGCGGVGAEWPQWQGPTRDNISQETGWLKNWPEGGPDIVWRIPIWRRLLWNLDRRWTHLHHALGG